MKVIKLSLGLIFLFLAQNISAQSVRSKVVLYDDFYDNAKEWASKYNSEVSMGVSNGHYYFDHKRTSGAWYSSLELENFDPNRDWVIEAKFRHTNGIQNNGYGIIFGRQDNKNQFEFFIANTGHYLIKQYRNGNRSYLNPAPSGKSWTKTALVRKKNYQYNTLKVVKESSKWKFYINGNLATTIFSKTWPGNRVGFVVNKKQRMEVDYISVKQKEHYVAPIVNNNNSYNAPPKISIYEPQANRGLSVVKARTVRVAGKVEDSDGVFEVKINGIDTKLSADGYFSLEVPLAIGQNTLRIVASDTRRKISTSTITVKREANIPNDQHYVQTTNPVAHNTNQRRLALLIGNSAYQNNGTLPNPVNDVRSMKNALENLGFSVLKFENCSQKDMRKAMDEFGKKLENYDVALFFYAGHGVQVAGRNYLVPIDAALKNKNDVEYDCVQAGRILGKMEASKAKTNIVILDACRDNPFERSWSRSAQGKGLAFMNAPSGSFVAYATSPGKTASDGTGQNGLYTAALLEHIKTPGLQIEEVFKRVRKTVKKKSGGKQIPWESTSLEGAFIFK